MRVHEPKTRPPAMFLLQGGGGCAERIPQPNEQTWQLEKDARKEPVDIHRHVAEIDRQIGLIQQLVNPA